MCHQPPPFCPQLQDTSLQVPRGHPSSLWTRSGAYLRQRGGGGRRERSWTPAPGARTWPGEQRTTVFCWSPAQSRAARMRVGVEGAALRPEAQGAPEEGQCGRDAHRVCRRPRVPGAMTKTHLGIGWKTEMSQKVHRSVPAAPAPTAEDPTSSCCGPGSKAPKSQPCPPAPHPILRKRARSPLVVSSRHCSGLSWAGSALWGSWGP